MKKLVRPKITEGPTQREVTSCGNIYIVVNRSEGQLIEVFARLGKSGSCSYCQLEALTRSISLGLKYGIPVEEYVKELRGIKCPNPAWNYKYQILSCPDAIAKVLEDESRNYSSDK